MADVIFRLDADNAKAVNAFLRMVDSQSKAERQFKKTTAAASLQDKTMNRMSATFSKIGAGLLALGGASSVVGTLTQIVQGMDRAAKASASLETEIRPLLSLGDNFRDIESIRQRVLSGSTGLGRGSKEVTDAFFALQSGASNLSNTVRNDLFKSASELAFLQNGDLAGSVNLLVKFYQNYGDRVRSVTDLSEKLFATADRGALTLDELARFGPDVAAAAKVMNISFEELLGTLIVTTQQLGRNERTFTGVRNVILRMSNAQREGINLTGSFTDKLQQLAQVDPDMLKKVFGDEAISAIAVASRNAGAIAAEVNSLNSGTGQLREKLKGIIGDARQLAAINLASAEQAFTNTAAGNLSPEVSKSVLRGKDIATGLAGTAFGQISPDFTKILGGIGGLALSFDEYLKNEALIDPRRFNPLSQFALDAAILEPIRNAQTIGTERRLDAQQRNFPEAAAANYYASGDLKPGNNNRGDTALLSAANKLERAAASLERTGNRRSINAQRE